MNIDTNLAYYKHLSIPSGELRISIVAGCDMRCWYCHNEGQGDFTSQKLSIEQIDEIVGLGKRFGISKVRLTGGEPLIHPRIFDILDMIKVKHQIRNVGINTNGTKLDALKSAKLKELNIDNVVVGLDYFDEKISKDSPVGKSSKQIRENILVAHGLGLNVQVATVCSESSIDNITNMVSWCLSNNILIKLLEVSDEKVATESSPYFLNVIKVVSKKFSLRLGKTVATNETYGINDNGSKVLFFHSHCKVRQCHECSLMHMRITSSGYAKPCILRTDTEFNVLGENRYSNLLKAIHNLGNPPENSVR